jgi:hypothetical protein
MSQPPDQGCALGKRNTNSLSRDDSESKIPDGSVVRWLSCNVLVSEAAITGEVRGRQVRGSQRGFDVQHLKGLEVSEQSCR